MYNLFLGLRKLPRTARKWDSLLGYTMLFYLMVYVFWIGKTPYWTMVGYMQDALHQPRQGAYSLTVGTLKPQPRETVYDLLTFFLFLHGVQHPSGPADGPQLRSRC